MNFFIRDTIKNSNRHQPAGNKDKNGSKLCKN